MKLLSCWALAYLALAVLAIDLHSPQQDAELPHGAYWKDETTVVVANDGPAIPDEDEDTAQEVTVDFSDSVASLANTTTPNLNERGILPGQYVVEVRVGRTTIGNDDEHPNDTPQHVGTLRGHRLYRPIYDCLKVIGHPQGLGPKKGVIPKYGQVKGHPMYCGDNDEYCQAQCVIPNIVYNSGKDTYATNAHLEVSVRWSEIWEEPLTGLREVMYSAVANAYMKMVEDEANCYTVHFRGSRATKMCNISRHLVVAFPTNGGTIAARLNVEIGFNGKTDEGKFDCDKAIGPIDTDFRKQAKPAIAKVLKWDESKIAVFTTCQSPKCFNYGEKNGYKFGKEWEEPPNCDAPKGEAS